MSKERLTIGGKEIISSPEELSPNVSYQELIEKYGGKAAGLLWIKKHLPETPMARMVVASPQTREEEIIQAAESAGLKFPWIIRPSNPHDNEVGYEGRFPTYYAQDKNDDLIRKISLIKYSDDENSTIIAEANRSFLVGTLVIHPHNPQLLLANISNIRYPHDRTHAFYKVERGQPKRLKNFSLLGHEIDVPTTIEPTLSDLSRWIERLKFIPEFGGKMSYQVEFCPDSPMIYQIRDFLPIEIPRFKVLSQEFDYSDELIIFGTTSAEGILVRTYKYNEEWHRMTYETEDGESYHFSSIVSEIPGFFKTDLPIGVVGSVRDARVGRFLRSVNVMYGSGLFAHEDIRMIRQSRLNIFAPGTLYWLDKKNKNYQTFEDGGVYRIISNGINIHISRLS